MSSGDSQLRRAPGLLSRRLPDRLLLLRPGGAIVTLAGTGVAVWDELGPGDSARELVARVVSRFEGDHVRMASDITSLVDQLVAAGVAERREGGDRLR